jgi:predicted DCC family thiol-disulfide oxidoreductase YuxK
MTWKLFYDGGCNLCHASKLRAERWAEARGQSMEVDILQNDEARSKGSGTAMVLEADGQVYSGADAWLRLMSIAPWYLRWIGWCRLTPPTRWLASALYRIVAHYRYKWFGTRACPLPSGPAAKPPA